MLGATLNLDLSNDLLDAAASLRAWGRLRGFRSVGGRLGGPQGWHGRHPELGGPQHRLVRHCGVFMDLGASWVLL